MDFFRRHHWDIVGKWPLWFTVSAVPIVLGLIFLFMYSLNFGIDFTGGSLFTFDVSEVLQSTQDSGAAIGKIRAALPPEMQQTELQLGQTGRSIQVLVRTAAHDKQTQQTEQVALQRALATALGDSGNRIKLVKTDLVGAVVSADLVRNAIMALLIGSLLIILYITIRYEFRFAVSGWLALIHDVLVLTGAMALLRIEINSTFVAVVLTILGYSIHDTIIIFDRIRENRRLHHGVDLADTVNGSIMQTMTRSINTILCTLFPLIALFFLGGETIHGFSLALIIGIISGGYSSIFMAAPIVVLWYGKAAHQRVSAAYAPRQVRPRAESAALTNGQGGSEGTPAPAPVRSSAATMANAQQAAQTAKRDARRERRAEKKSDKTSAPEKPRKKRF